MRYENRLETDSTTNGEITFEPIPPIDVLEFAFASELSNGSRRRRFSNAQNMIKRYKSHFKVSDRTENLSESELVSTLFMSTVDFLAHRYNFEAEKNKQRELGDTYPIDSAYLLNGSRTRIRQDMEGYVDLFEDSDPIMAHEGLQAIFYEARCLILDREHLNEDLEAENRKTLAGLMAEVKVLRALRQNGWERTYYGEPKEDTEQQTDLVIYFESESRKIQYLRLQVKSNKDINELQTRLLGYSDIILIRVPAKACLKLSDADQETLTDGISQFAAERYSPAGI